EQAVLLHLSRLIGRLYDLLEALVLVLGIRQQLVAGVDIGLVVDVVVEFERLARHAMRGQRVVRVGKVGQFESHGVLSVLCSRAGCGLPASQLYRPGCRAWKGKPVRHGAPALRRARLTATRPASKSAIPKAMTMS